MLGRRVKGAVITRRRMPQMRDVDLLAHISKRSGEYDAIEKQNLSDPFVDGYRMREDGVAYDDIDVYRKGLRRAVYEERIKLMQRGWNKCNTEKAG